MRTRNIPVFSGPPVRVCVASLNTAVATELCIRSLRRFASYPFDLTVGDSGSSDGTIRMLQLFERRGWLQLEVHAGREHAQWLDHWRGEMEAGLLVFVDSDVEFRKPGWLEDMVNAAATSGAAVVCAEMLSERARFVEPVRLKLVRLARRPAPWLLMIDIEKTRGIHTSFEFHADYEAKVAEGILAYDLGARFFSRVDESGQQWVVMPRGFAKKFRHFGGLSWRPSASGRSWLNRRSINSIDGHLRRLRAEQGELSLLSDVPPEFEGVRR